MTRDDLMAAFKREVIPFDGLHLRVWSAGERAAVVAYIRAVKDAPDYLAKLYTALFIRGVCDAGGARLFGDDDAALVADLDGLKVERVATRVGELNGLSEGGAGNS